MAVAMRTSPLAMGVSRLSDGAFVEVNDAFCRLFGWERGEVLGRSSVALGLWPDPERRVQMLEQLQRQPSISGYEARYRNRLGETGEVEISATLITHDGVPHLVGFLTEVSGRRELLEGLRTAQSRLGVALRASGLLVFRQDHALRYTWVANPALGAEESEVLGRTDEELMGAEAAKPLVGIKRRVLESGRAERRDVWVANKGQLGCFDLVVEPERDGAGRVCGIVCAAQDITARMMAPRRGPPAPLQAIEGMTALLGREHPSPRQAQRLQRIGRESRRLAGHWLRDLQAPAESLRSRCAGRLVLVAEHNPVLRELLAGLLEAAGLRVALATTGVEAFSLALQLAPALLLLDMELPQRGGVAAARALRTMVGPALPIVAMISSPSPGDAADALDADLDDVIDRPVRADLLYTKVLAWLEPAR